MAGSQREHESDLRLLLATRGNNFGFFTAVRLLHRLNPTLSPIGELGPVEKEAVRFSQDPALIFHSSDIASLTFDTQANGVSRARLVTTFLGLYGVNSPLATHFSEELIRAEIDDEESLRSFYDVFHHRLLSLFYRAWKKYRMPVGFRADGSDTATQRMFAFVGRDTHIPEPLTVVPPFLQLSLAPILAMRTRPARTLLAVLTRVFPGLGFHIESFIERTVRIRDEERVQLSRRNNRLGVDCTIGYSVKDRSGRFRLVVGPVTQASGEDFLPGGRHFPELTRIVDYFVGKAVECELEVVVRAAMGLGLQLGSRETALLGLNSQIGSRKREERRLRVLLVDDPGGMRPQVITVADATAA